MESPAFVMPPSLCRPPVEWSLGVSPSHAAKSRPDLNVSGGGAFMLSIDDPIRPMPGIVAIRLLMSSSLGELGPRHTRPPEGGRDPAPFPAGYRLRAHV